MCFIILKMTEESKNDLNVVDLEDVMGKKSKIKSVLIEPVTKTEIYQKDILFFKELYHIIKNGEFNKQKTINKLRKKYKANPSKISMFHIYRNLIKTEPDKFTKHRETELIITKKVVKSHSGIVVVTILTSGGETFKECKNDCFYCPNDPTRTKAIDVKKGEIALRVPRSYLAGEPAVIRALQNNFDPIRQINCRLDVLKAMGHFEDRVKMQLDIIGATWSHYDRDYRDWFITSCYFAANTYFDKGPIESKREMLSLEQEKQINETTDQVTITAISLETRPDQMTHEECRSLLSYGCTRIQLGIQTDNDAILKKINRGCTHAQNLAGIYMAKEYGFKVELHFMQSLPGSTPEMDIKTIMDNMHLGDYLKFYPIAITPFTKIKEWYDAGTFKPWCEGNNGMDLVEMLLKVMPHIPLHCRLSRCPRDFISPDILGGCKDVNLRQILVSEMKKEELLPEKFALVKLKLQT